MGIFDFFKSRPIPKTTQITKKIDSVHWYCYRLESDGRAAFDKLRASRLGGPGMVELRFNRRASYRWWVVTYNIIAGTSATMERVYGIPGGCDPASWFPYEGEQKLKLNTKASRLIDSFKVRANLEGLIKAQKELNDIYLDWADGRTVTTEAEAHKRLQKLQRKPKRGE